MENTLLYKDVLWIIGSVVAIVAFAKLITAPFKSIDAKIVAQEKTFNNKIEEQEKILKNLESTIQNQQILLNSSLKIQLLLLQHTVYGNHTDAIKEKMQELEATIIDTK